jgi:hypothetical protein
MVVWMSGWLLVLIWIAFNLAFDVILYHSRRDRWASDFPNFMAAAAMCYIVSGLAVRLLALVVVP